MKQIFRRVAFFSFLACLTLIAIASRSNPHSKCDQEWKKGALVNNNENSESLVEAHTHDNSYELNWPTHIFKYIMN